jgi:hypothetical protein
MSKKNMPRLYDLYSLGGSEHAPRKTIDIGNAFLAIRNGRFVRGGLRQFAEAGRFQDIWSSVARFAHLEYERGYGVSQPGCRLAFSGK